MSSTILIYIRRWFLVKKQGRLDEVDWVVTWTPENRRSVIQSATAYNKSKFKIQYNTENQKFYFCPFEVTLPKKCKNYVWPYWLLVRSTLPLDWQMTWTEKKLFACLILQPPVRASLVMAYRYSVDICWDTEQIREPDYTNQRHPLADMQETIVRATLFLGKKKEFSFLLWNLRP